MGDRGLAPKFWSAANVTPGPKPNPIPQGLGEISSEMDYQSFGQARDDQHSSGEALRGPGLLIH